VRAGAFVEVGTETVLLQDSQDSRQSKKFEKADEEQLAYWYRFLPSGETAADQRIVSDRTPKGGGFDYAQNVLTLCGFHDKASLARQKIAGAFLTGPAV
jgi:hypothetical protein